MRKLVVFLVVLCYSSMIMAEPLRHQMRLLPIGERVGEGEESRACYSFDDYKQLVILDDELWTARQIIQEQARLVEAVRDSSRNLEEQLRLSLASLAVLQKENARVNRLWVETDEALQEELSSPAPLWIWALGVGGGAALLLAGGLVIGSYVGR